MSLVTITKLSHAFGDKTLYKDADLSLCKGEHMGIVGQNGTGKSTLLKILLGEVIPTEGHIAWQKKIQIGHLDQYAQVDGTLTLDAYLHTAFSALYDMERRLDCLYMRMSRGEAEEQQLAQAARLQEALEAADFYAVDSRVGRVAAGLGLAAIGMDKRLDTLSGGQHTKAILGKLLLSQPDVLLLDEPTNFLDAAHIAWLSGFLREFTGSFMIVSHDFAFLDAITNCICDIEFQTLTKYHGAYHAFVRQKEHLRADYIRRYEAQRREIEKLEAYIAKNKVRASTASMAKSRQKKLDKMDKLAPTTVQGKPQMAFSSVPIPASRVLTVRDLLVGYDTPLLPRLSFGMAGGEKLAITGFNGIGKSTLLKTLMGEMPALGGTYAFSREIRMAYFAQDMAWQDAKESPLEMMTRAHPSLTPKLARGALAKYGVKAEHVMRPVRTLSGGEQAKVKLCLIAYVPANFLVLDEPTNHLDAEAKAALAEAIDAFSGCVILVSHEPAFFKGLVNREISLSKMTDMRKASTG